MRVGIFFQFHNFDDWGRFGAKRPGPPDVTDAQVYDEELFLVGLIEELGFDKYWAVDHYCSPYAMTGGVLQHLAYIAGRTRRVDLGTMVTVLPWYDPIRLAHQISVVDNLLQGRHLTLGVGRGAAVREFDAFGVPMGDARGRYNETLEIIRLAMTKEWFSYQGAHFTIPETAVRPHFRNPERILADMRAAWASPDSLPLAAHAGLGMLLTNYRPWADYRAEVARYNALRAEHGWGPTRPTAAVRAACYETEAEAWHVMSTYGLQVEHSATNHYQLLDRERFAATKGYENYGKIPRTNDEDMVERSLRPQAWGTPDQVYDKLVGIQQMTGAEDVVLGFRFGSQPLESAERSIRLFASEVLPRLHAYEPVVDVPTLDPRVSGGAAATHA